MYILLVFNFIVFIQIIFLALLFIKLNRNIDIRRENVNILFIKIMFLS